MTLSFFFFSFSYRLKRTNGLKLSYKTKSSPLQTKNDFMLYWNKMHSRKETSSATAKFMLDRKIIQ